MRRFLTKIRRFFWMTEEELECQRQIDFLKWKIEQNNKHYADVKINFQTVRKEHGKEYVKCVQCWKETWNMTSVVTQDGHYCPDCYNVVRYR